MDSGFLSTKCYFIEKSGASRQCLVGHIRKPLKIFKIGKLSDSLCSDVRKTLVSACREAPNGKICFRGILGDGITGCGESFRANIDKYSEVFDLWRSLKLTPCVYVDISKTCGDKQEFAVRKTAERVSEFLGMTEMNDTASYWKHGSFEIIRSRETDDPIFMETYAAIYDALKTFSKNVRVGFRVGMDSMMRAFDLFEENLILSKRHECVPDFVTLAVSPMPDGVDKHMDSQAKHAMHIIHDSGAHVKALYVFEHEYASVPDGVCDAFEAASRFSDIAPESDYMVSQMIRLLLSCA